MRGQRMRRTLYKAAGEAARGGSSFNKINQNYPIQALNGHGSREKKERLVAKAVRRMGRAK